MIPQTKYTFSSALSAGCPNGYYFSTPRTPQQNSLLYRLALSQLGAGFDALLLSYNDDTYPGCWVRGTDICPYYDAVFPSFESLAQTKNHD